MSLVVEYCRDVELSTGEVVGLSFTAQAGFVSAIAVVVLLGVIVFKCKNRAREPSSSWKLVRTNIDGLMLNLLIADLFVSLGAILDIKWAHNGKVSCGGHCNAQGAIQLVGETAVALFTLAITILTFMTVIKGRAARCSVFVWGGVGLGVWVFAMLWAVVGVVVNDEFYAPTPYWCWISPKYKVERLLGEYIWLWLAGFGSVLLYTPLFFMLRGNVVWDSEGGWRSVRWRWKRSAMSIVSAQGGLSPYKLLWYPLAYTIVVLPVSIVRWMSHERIPSDEMATATFVTVSIFNLSGVINVTLILLTRTNVLGLGSTRSRSDTLESTKPEHLPEPDGTALEPEQDEQWETGFGGPRVILRDDDSEFDSGRINRDRSRSPGESALGLTGMEKSPGREYLESLGMARTR